MIVAATKQQIQYVVDHMRADDRREVLANCWTDDLDLFSEQCCQLPGFAGAALNKSGIPVAVGGIANHLPMVGQAWLIGTDDIASCSIELAHFCRRLPQRLFSSGSLHRVQAFSAAFHTQAHDWIRLMGLKEEARLRQFGKGGEDFIVFSMVKEH